MSGRYPDDPVTHPVAFHTWEALTFVHFAYDVAAVQPLVPDRLTVQEWEGATWVGITPFRMADVRAPFLPPPPGWGAFAELNVRCYVRRPDGPVAASTVLLAQLAVGAGTAGRWSAVQ